jgi:methionyl-tRNA synthetase
VSSETGNPPDVNAVQPAPVAVPVPQELPRISIEEFARVQMRTGEIVEAEMVAGSKKLVRLLVDIGTEKRQVVAGIGKKYAPEALLKRKVIIVANLQPARLMGVESNGMVVAAVGPGDEPILAGFNEDVPNGARLR